MGDLLQPWHIIVLAIVAFLLFGAKRLPELGKGLGEGLKGFREGIKGHFRSASAGATGAADPATEHRPRRQRRTHRSSRNKAAGTGRGRIQPQVERAFPCLRCRALNEMKSLCERTGFRVFRVGMIQPRAYL